MRKEKKKKPKTKAIEKKAFFSERTKQHDLSRIQEAYDYVKGGTSYDKKRRQMRAIQLAQQLVDPKIQNTQVILAALKLKMQAASKGIVTESIGETDESCRSYFSEATHKNLDQAWMQYINCLLRIVNEDSVIETDVYNYAQANTVEDEDVNDGDNPEIILNSEAPNITRTDLPDNENTTPLNTNSETNNRRSRGSFLSRFFGRNTKNNQS